MKLANGKPLVIAGCVPQGAPRSSYLSHYSTIGVQQIDRVVEVVEETLKGFFHALILINKKITDDFSR
jgi:threonylcarbamoyladenosine tRNA methylthiotransferase CDKAL1